MNIRRGCFWSVIVLACGLAFLGLWAYNATHWPVVRGCTMELLVFIPLALLLGWAFRRKDRG